VFGGGLVGPARAEEQLEGGEDRPAAGVDHVGEAEGQVRGRLGGRGVDQAQLAAAGEQADRDAGVAKQPLELRGRGITPGAGAVLGLVEREARRRAVVAQVPEQGEVGAGGGRGGRRGGVRVLAEAGEQVVGGRGEGAAGEGEARAQLLAALLGVEAQRVGQALAGDQHALAVVAEELGEQAAQVGGPQAGVRVLGQQGPEAGGELGADLRGDLGVDQHRRREHEALDRLGQAEPLLVEAGLSVLRIHVIASGQAMTRPTGVRRVIWTA